MHHKHDEYTVLYNSPIRNPDFAHIMMESKRIQELDCPVVLLEQKVV